MIVRFLGGPLAGRVLETIGALWAGGWLAAGDADWGLHLAVYHDLATGIVLAEARVTIPRRR
ncbi:hypothetical protein [Streptomyces sp. NPDC002265]|uniref:hypothetical protein n=1 Tax=Streptomyces sp. NPDC002265 TaxID=3154415 RepID=UPI0033212ACD